MRGLGRGEIRHPLAEGKDHALQRGGGHVVGKLQSGDVIHPHAGAQAMAGVHEKGRRILDPAGDPAQRIGQEGGNVQRGGGVVHLVRAEPFPADRPDPGTLRHDPGQPVGQARRPPRLRGQRQRGRVTGADLSGHHHRRDAGVGQAFVAGQEQRVGGRHHQHRLFEARIEARQPAQVGGMFAVAVDDDGGKALLGRPRAQRGHAGPGFFQREGRRQVGAAEIRPFDPAQVAHLVSPWRCLRRGRRGPKPSGRAAIRPGPQLASAAALDYIHGREVGAGKRLANPVRSGRKQP